MNEEFHEAICQEVVWKNGEMRSFAVELVRGAIQRFDEFDEERGDEEDTLKRDEFTTDIVPDEARGDGHGIAGSVIELLKNANVIEAVGATIGLEWYAKRVKSSRAGCKSRYVGVYRLKSLAVARSFLNRNRGIGEVRSAEQLELVG